MTDLDEIYRGARYVVVDDGVEITIRLGDKGAELHELLRRLEATTWAFLTAYNPLSQQIPDHENRARQDELKSLAGELGYRFLEGYGTGDDWDPEPSIFDVDIEREDAIRLADRFEQHAILFGRIDQRPELVWCRPK